MDIKEEDNGYIVEYGWSPNVRFFDVKHFHIFFLLFLIKHTIPKNIESKSCEQNICCVKRENCCIKMKG